VHHDLPVLEERKSVKDSQAFLFFLNYMGQNKWNE
jgi:hypothetical protein